MVAMQALLEIVFPSQAIAPELVSLSEGEKVRFCMEPKHYRDMTGSQRLLLLYRYIMANKVLKPGSYAKKVGISRPAVYYQIQLLSGAAIPIVRAAYGKWTLLEFLDDFEKYDDQAELDAINERSS